MPSPCLPELRRICVLDDGRAKAIFSDNTIIVTNSTGSAFIIRTQDGHLMRQVSEYALTRHCPLLAAVLEFRNMHVDLPCFCKPLARVLRSGFTLGYVIRDATWPTPSHAIAEGLAQVQPDGKVALSSEDGVAQIVLHRHQRRFAVCYPLLVAERPQEGQYEYVWQTQVFSVASHPPRWRPAVLVALFVADQLRRRIPSPFPGSGQPTSLTQMTPDPGWLGDLNAGAHPSERALLCSTDAEGVASGSAAPADRRSALPSADDSVRSTLTEQIRTDNWWVDPSLSFMPPDDVLVFEWTPHATYQFLPEENEVEVWVHADESCMVSKRGGRFLEHFKDAGESGSQLYAASSVPEAVWSRDQTYRYPLGALATHALKVRAHNTTLTAAKAARAPAVLKDSSVIGPDKVTCDASGDDLFAVMSTTIIEERGVPGYGQFTAYEDGRVRVCFKDRTILHMSASQSHCKVLLPDGKAVVVAVANPVGVELYVETALEFVHWAFRTPEERAEELCIQARVHAELVNSQRMARVCEYSAKGTMPIARAQPESLAGVCTVSDTVADRRSIVEKLLNENARLLQKLCEDV
ncbi:hypothetical protein VOLCADRAFT_98324 [Volvox carteri f. nagariensis]|uniref:DUF4520 domain-containing protein n=1 Tax=Volvox carteri f. nagariensis TaxID=3068 RepID=D8UEX5_VOLCA|nr:uncharacterized protein VOLCADRAFT_98324 [Volvox carteri f. nagariensis]EFJ41759.1 hypothetical protein VOLCADRAFT_98324 [Volvox carteri f. nagariensis]|eukprot:XP_002957261.1 hypothetical protein VOLCADRAFT_98324 [Volvox carteri f. nagariensis]